MSNAATKFENHWSVVMYLASLLREFAARILVERVNRAEGEVNPLA